MPIKTLSNTFIPDWPMLRQEYYHFFLKKIKKSEICQVILFILLSAFVRKLHIKTSSIMIHKQHCLSSPKIPKSQVPQMPHFRLGQKVCTFPNFCQKIRKTSKKYSFSKSPQNVVTICTAGSYKIFHVKSEHQLLKRKWISALRQAKTNSSRKVPDEIRNILSGGYFLESLLTDKPLPDKNKNYRIFISAAELIADSHWAGLITAL